MLNPALRGFYESQDIRNFVLYGGRASTKTYHTAAFCVFLAMNYRAKFLCTRQFQNRISDSVKTVIEECIYKLKKESEFHITETGIVYPATGANFTFLGIQRNLKEIKGIANVDVLWIEEAEDLTAEQWKVLEPTIREEGSKIFIVFNPKLASDFVYQRFVVNPPEKTLVRLINYTENPFLSQTMRDIIEDHKARDFEEYEHIYLGVPLTDDERVIIKSTWIEAAIDAHIKLGFEAAGKKVIGFDVADDGADRCANVQSHGSVVLWGEEWKGGEDELLKSCSRTYRNAIQRECDIVYDCIGVGASAGAKFDELNSATDRAAFKIRYTKFNAGGAVEYPEKFYAQDKMARIKNKDYFSNVKAQVWWLLADRFRNTYDAITNGTKYPVDELISISSQFPLLAKLKAELSTPKRDFDLNGRVKVESKKDLAKRDVASPNCADALVMCYTNMHKPMVISGNLLRKI
jgi:phage terminase large subunit